MLAEVTNLVSNLDIILGVRTSTSKRYHMVKVYLLLRSNDFLADVAEHTIALKNAFIINLFNNRTTLKRNTPLILSLLLQSVCSIVLTVLFSYSVSIGLMISICAFAYLIPISVTVSPSIFALLLSKICILHSSLMIFPQLLRITITKLRYTGFAARNIANLPMSSLTELFKGLDFLAFCTFFTVWQQWRQRWVFLFSYLASSGIFAILTVASISIEATLKSIKGFFGMALNTNLSIVIYFTQVNEPPNRFVGLEAMGVATACSLVSFSPLYHISKGVETLVQRVKARKASE